MAREPIAVGTKVAVIRTRHGWHDGALEATVTNRWPRPTGTWSYMVRDLEGTEHEVNHTRDMRAIRG